MASSGSKQKPTPQNRRNRDFGNTALHRSVNKRSLTSVLECLALNKGLLDLRNKQGWTALHLAVSNIDWPMVALLLNKGANVDKTNNQGGTALHFAADNGKVEIVEKADKGKVEIVEKLLEHGAKMDIRNNQGWTALHVAADKGKVEIVEKLLEHGANMDIRTTEQKLTALALAKKNLEAATSYSTTKPSYQRIIETLRVKGALKKKNWPLVMTILEQENHGINVKTLKVENQTLWDMAVENLDLKLVTLLLEKHDFDPKDIGKSQLEALFGSALYHEDWETAKCLVQHQPERISLDRSTIEKLFASALYRDDWETVKSLLRHNERISVDQFKVKGNSNSLLHLAVQRRDFTMITKLIDNHHANVDIQNGYKQTPLNLAVYSYMDFVYADRSSAREYYKAAELLVDRNARVDMVDQAGSSPLFYARGNEAMRELLSRGRRQPDNRPKAKSR